MQRIHQMGYDFATMQPIFSLTAVLLVFLLAVTASPATVRADEFLPRSRWGDLLVPAKVDGYLKSYAEKAAADPADYESRVRGAAFAFYAWRLEKESNARRLQYAKIAFKLGQEAVKIRPNGAEGLHWVGAGVGMIGLTRGVLNSLQLIPTGKAAFEKSRELDPTYFSASAAAQLGRIYTMVPGFPISIGDKKKAIEYLLEAKRIAPTASLWPLYLADVYWAVGLKEKALQEVQLVKKLQPTVEHEYFTYHMNLHKAAELEALIRSGANRDPFYDVLSDIQPGLVD